MFGVTLRGSEIVESPATDDAKRHIKKSLLVAAIVLPAILILFVVNGLDWPLSLGLAGGSAYVVWAWYWGIVALVNVLTGRNGEIAKGFIENTWLLEGRVGAGILAVLCILGILYGPLGGGILEFLKYRKIAKTPNLVIE